MANKFTSFFSESKQELKRVSWPTRDELVQSTILVIVVTLIMAVFIGILDAIFSFLIRLLVG
ncbi:MAG: preprotein translocase subunit SecE [Candidatus Omnitrophica bacterium CG11_big_fil_rev_8_21_14_0_20_45_26]|uniref:Protein translocase subunit SecE n=1 Tax=Candidatus Abzuiibacterium crystallinum TaxID=1974748 RepID=A0A2H0LNA1_9BACT|nr:MAG: preprotein translocase subunit SecE [Candidatus Omnitrophica bacterium CG11_big_fil_rev_8_21_14_0_20_45_26]PIW63434.1 MAG: preprotein translocase subunit SecE [Candidatus Omnitrophica bacterium CG12_big_fil_rev_8_21_14_0_65_45_16]